MSYEIAVFAVALKLISIDLVVKGPTITVI